jgi:hypothetical protein
MIRGIVTPRHDADRAHLVTRTIYSPNSNQTYIRIKPTESVMTLLQMKSQSSAPKENTTTASEGFQLNSTAQETKEEEEDNEEKANNNVEEGNSIVNQ